MMRTTFRTFAPFLAIAFALAGCNGSPPASETASGKASVQSGEADTVERIVRQEPGKIVYWVLPGPRKLSPEVFGTPDHPRMTVADKMQTVKQMQRQGRMPPHVDEILQNLPILVGVPVGARSVDENGDMWFRQPNPFSDRGRIITGSFDAHYWDSVDADPPGPPGKTPDRATMETEFSDPAGNDYRVVLDHVVKPPFPGYETEGGVMVDSVHHGSTGTGSPLMPRVETLAAFWGIGDVYINGELAQPKRVMHMMTTEVVRDRDYRLASSDELPLPASERIIKGQEHHTHLVVLPIKVGKEGPEFSPLKTAFQLPNGKPQPFMHIMFEQDDVVQ